MIINQCGAILARLNGYRQARSSVVEHHLDMVVVGGSIPLVPTRYSKNYIYTALPNSAATQPQLVEDHGRLLEPIRNVR